MHRYGPEMGRKCTDQERDLIGPIPDLGIGPIRFTGAQLDLGTHCLRAGLCRVSHLQGLRSVDSAPGWTFSTQSGLMTFPEPVGLFLSREQQLTVSLD